MTYFGFKTSTLHNMDTTTLSVTKMTNGCEIEDIAPQVSWPYPIKAKDIKREERRERKTRNKDETRISTPIKMITAIGTIRWKWEEIQSMNTNSDYKLSLLDNLCVNWIKMLFRKYFSQSSLKVKCQVVPDLALVGSNIENLTVVAKHKKWWRTRASQRAFRLKLDRWLGGKLCAK